MIVGMKDAARLVRITIISFCAVFVCGLFTNYYMDISGIEAVLLPGKVAAFYNAQVSTAKVVVPRQRRLPSCDGSYNARLLHKELY